MCPPEALAQPAVSRAADAASEWGRLPPNLHHQIVTACQVCGHAPLEPVLFLGYHVPVNWMRPVDAPLRDEPAFPTQLLICPACQLAQIGFIVDQRVLFPPDYPYTTGTTRILWDNFAQLANEVRDAVRLRPGDLVIDIGSNDGTLLRNFQPLGCRVLGIEPTLKAQVANERGILSRMAFFTPAVAREVLTEHGPARLVTATNVFAHIPDIHAIIEGIGELLAPDGVFISESHYFADLVATLQYDTIYHEHLRYYTVRSLAALLRPHGFRLIRARRIPTHGGSIRVYATRDLSAAVDGSVAALLAEEEGLVAGSPRLRAFREQVLRSKLDLVALLRHLKQAGKRIVGLGAPSRASTLINYAGLDDGLLDCVFEIAGSTKIGRYMPGTVIPVREETALYEEQPDYALCLSWHIWEELKPKLERRGFRGDFIVPLPTPRIIPGGLDQ